MARTAKKIARKTGEIKKALEILAEEKKVSTEEVFNAFKESLVAAARKSLKLNKNIEVDVDPETEDIQVILRVEVVEDFPDYEIPPALTGKEEISLFVEKNDQHYMLVEDAKEFHPEAQAGYMLEVALPFENFGRLAIQEARQRLKHGVNAVERNRVFEIYKNKIGTLINGQVELIEKNDAIISMGSNTKAVLPNRERMSKDRWKIGQSVKAVIKEISEPSKGQGALVVLSRINNDFVRELFKQEIPEVYDGTIEIKAIAREPGYRAKVAVFSRDDRVDPSGACIGVKGQRIQSITRELNNERIDVVHWDSDPDIYLRRALGSSGNVNVIKHFETEVEIPAKEKSDEVKLVTRTVVIVGDEDVGLVIGERGQAIKLTGKLLGKDIVVFSESDWSNKTEEEREAMINKQDSKTNAKKGGLGDLFNNGEENTELAGEETAESSGEETAETSTSNDANLTGAENSNE